MKNRLTVDQEVRILADCLKQVVIIVSLFPSAPPNFKAHWIEQLKDIQVKGYELEDEDGGRYELQGDKEGSDG